MEGSKLILKRKIPRGRQQIAAIFVGAFAVIALIAIAQMKTTLSAHALASVKEDFASMKTQFGETAAAPTPMSGSTEASTPTATPADTAVEKFKKLLQDVPVKE
ncbi:MAG: hypothetical protein WC813_00240 [Patescibacteria group bacterium]|jgi:hypothetical protein